VSRTLSRIVRTNPPTLSDFTSHAALGRRLRNPTPELLDRWAGLSAYDAEEQARWRAREASRRGRALGEFISVMEVGSEFRVEQTFDRGHYTVWGEPAALLECVVRTFPV
jgi:hypothetical protein